MKGPVRLRDAAASPFESALLGSWKAENPSADAKGRALAIAALLPASLPDHGETPDSGLFRTRPKSAMPMAKRVLLGGAGAATLVALWAIVPKGDAHTPSVNPSATSVRTVPAPPAPPAPLVELPQPILATAPAQETTPLERAARAVPAPVAAAPRRAAPSGPASASLAEEISRIDAARAALRSGDSRLAESRIAAYRDRFPAGALVEEAEVVRIEALVAHGDVRSARALADSFAVSFPKSSHRPQLEQLVSANPR